MAQESRVRAIIYLPDAPDAARWKRVCVEYCERHGYEVVAIIHARGDGLAEWQQLWTMGAEHDVLVVAREDHLPVQRVPRIEVVADEPGPTRRPRPRPRFTR